MVYEFRLTNKTRLIEPEYSKITSNRTVTYISNIIRACTERWDFRTNAIIRFYKLTDSVHLWKTNAARCLHMFVRYVAYRILSYRITTTFDAYYLPPEIVVFPVENLSRRRRFTTILPAELIEYRYTVRIFRARNSARYSIWSFSVFVLRAIVRHNQPEHRFERSNNNDT